MKRGRAKRKWLDKLTDWEVITVGCFFIAVLIITIMSTKVIYTEVKELKARHDSLLKTFNNNVVVNNDNLKLFNNHKHRFGGKVVYYKPKEEVTNELED